MKERLFLAADSGGSKTVWRLITQEGIVVFEYKTAGVGAIKANLLPVKETILEAAEKINEFCKPNGIFLSLGGPNVEEVRLNLENVWQDIPIKVEREANGNAILYAASFLQVSSVVMCGTGSVAVGDTENGRRYCGGWGPIFGDEGSGYGLSRDALKLFLKHIDGEYDAGATANLFEGLTAGLNIDTFEGRMALKGRVINLSRSEIAAHTPKIYNLAEKGDKTALKLYEESADEIANMVYSVCDNKTESRVLLCGGFFRNSPLLLKLCKEKIANLGSVKVVYQPEFSPILAAEFSVLKDAQIEITENIVNNILNNSKENQK